MLKKILLIIAIIFISTSCGLFAQNNELGIIEGFPKNFPADIPQPQNSKCKGYLNTSEGTCVTFESSDSALQIFDFYKMEMKSAGFISGLDGDSMINETGGLTEWNKDERKITLMVSYVKENNKSQIVITYK
jgi:hypothetical protein